MTFEAGAITLVMLSAYGMSVSQLVADIILRLCSSTLWELGFVHLEIILWKWTLHFRLFSDKISLSLFCVLENRTRQMCYQLESTMYSIFLTPISVFSRNTIYPD